MLHERRNSFIYRKLYVKNKLNLQVFLHLFHIYQNNKLNNVEQFKSKKTTLAHTTSKIL